MAKYYVDENGVYIGAFEGEHGIDLSAYTEVSSAPANASMIWNGITYIMPDPSLANAKLAKITDIDARTVELIEGGFTFDSHQFSLSLEAQLNWMGLRTMHDLLTWPFEITTMDDNAYSLADADSDTFVATALGVVAYHLETGRALKVDVNACTTVAEVNAIVDNR